MTRTRGPMVCLAAALLIACSPPSPEDGAPPQAPAQPANIPPAEPMSTESSLTIKRGVATLKVDSMTFKPCGEDRDYGVVDQTEGAVAEHFADALQGGPVSLYLEAYAERITDQSQPELKTDAAYVLEEVLYAAPLGENGGCAAKPPDFIVAARGNEPFWAAEVSEQRVVWRQPDEPREVIFGAPQTQDAEGAVRYRADAEGHQVELLIAAQPCRDSMSGAFFAFSAKAMFDGETLTGCARLGR